MCKGPEMETLEGFEELRGECLEHNRQAKER